MNYLDYSTQEPKLEESKKDPNSDFQCYHCGKIIQTLDKVKEHILEVHKCPPRRYGDPRQGLLNIWTEHFIQFYFMKLQLRGNLGVSPGAPLVRFFVQRPHSAVPIAEILYVKTARA